jgi:exopolysaccharide biosynthesis WecB/TagA/CpsF family protein
MATGNALRQITAAKTDILFVCMGVPNQEIWIHDNKRMLTGVKAAFGLGAFFDFFADSVKRAPLWMRRIRIEWIYRLYKEPRRLWRRYLLGNFIFFWHVLRFRLRKNG